MIKINIFSRLGIALFVSLCISEACNSKAGKPGDMNTEAFNLRSDTGIIATEFKEKDLNIDKDILWNDPNYNNAYLINDSIYIDFESVKPFFDSDKMHGRFSIHMDTNDIQKIFALYKTPYHGQNRLISTN
jgi:hypothetical protein